MYIYINEDLPSASIPGIRHRTLAGRDAGLSSLSVWHQSVDAGGAFAMIGKIMPSAWAMNGYQNILIRGLESESAWLPALVLIAYALGFFVLAVWRFRKMDV